MTIPKPMAITGLLLLLTAWAGAIFWWDAHQSGKLRQELAANQRSLDVLTASRDSARNALAKQVPQLDSLIDTLWLPARAKVESLPVGVPVPYPVYVETVNAADTTIKACRATLSACERVADLERARADTLANRVKLLERGEPFRLSAYGAKGLFDGGWYTGAMATGRVPLLPVEGMAQLDVRVDSLALAARVGVVLRF